MYELTQDEDLGPFIVLLFLILESLEFSAQRRYQLLWVMPPSVTSYSREQIMSLQPAV